MVRTADPTQQTAPSMRIPHAHGFADDPDIAFNGLHTDLQRWADARLVLSGTARVPLVLRRQPALLPGGRERHRNDAGRARLRAFLRRGTLAQFRDQERVNFAATA